MTRDARRWTRGRTSGRGGQRCVAVRDAVVLATIATLAAVPALADPLQIEPVVGLQETLTNNVRLEGNATRRSDLVTQITPSLRISETGAHSTIAGTIAAPILLYARTGSDNNRVVPQVALSGLADWEKRLFIEAKAVVSQQYVSPFGARPLDITSNPANQYNAATYEVSPFVEGDGPNRLHYYLRDDNTWTNTSSAPTSLGNAYTNQLNGNIGQEPAPVGWRVEYQRQRVVYSDALPLTTEIARYRQRFLPDPQFEFSLSGGYEDDDYSGLRFNGAVYGGGVRWRPTETTLLDGLWEHRFFGASYHVSFDHRTPLTVWSVRLSRDATTYPEQLANLGAGGDVSLLLNSIFQSRLPDPIARQQYVDQLIRDRGLPNSLSSPITIFNERISLVESATASAGIIGARNSVLLSTFRTRSRPITGDQAAPLISDINNNNVQQGGNVVFTHNLTPVTVLSGNLVYLDTRALAPFEGHTRQGGATVTIGRVLSPLTYVYLGGRYQQSRSDITTGYEEAAIFVGLTHLFH